MSGGLGGVALRHRQSRGEEVKGSLDSAHSLVAFLRQCMLTPPSAGELGRFFFFFNFKENIANIHLGLQTQAHTHTYYFIYFL